MLIQDAYLELVRRFPDASDHYVKRSSPWPAWACVVSVYGPRQRFMRGNGPSFEAALADLDRRHSLTRIPSLGSIIPMKHRRPRWARLAEASQQASRMYEQALCWRRLFSPESEAHRFRRLSRIRAALRDLERGRTPLATHVS